MKKKIISVILAVCVFMLSAVVSFAESAPTIKIGSSVDAEKKSVKITVTLENAANFNNGDFELTYDSSVISHEAKVTVNPDEITLDNMNVVQNFTDGKVDISVMYSQFSSDSSIVILDEEFPLTAAALQNQVDSTDVKVVSSKAVVNETDVNVAEADYSVGLHTNNEWKATKAPTCTEPGLETSVCAVCGKTETREIPATGHTPGDAVKENVVAVSCQHDGTHDEVVYCKVCGAELSRKTVVDAQKLKHKYGPAVTENVKQATCGEDGSYDRVIYCTVGGEVYSRVTYKIPATGKHTPGEAVIENYVAPTVTTAGSYDSVVYCTVCKKEISRTKVTIPALSVSFSDNSGETKDVKADDGTTVSYAVVFGAKDIASLKKTITNDASSYSVTDADGNQKADTDAVSTGELIKMGDKTYQVVLLGDVNKDGKVNAVDARLALRYSAKLDGNISAPQVEAAKVSNSDSVRAIEARAILRYSAKLISKFDRQSKASA